jgi:predicted RNA binding protein YcfA (HicA-like mRNA interferase family)
MTVREVLKRLDRDGWVVVRTRGDHRQLKHPIKAGKVTVSGHPSDDVHPKTLASIWRQARLEDEP